MYLLVKDRVEKVKITNIEPDDYTFVEEKEHYKRYSKSGEIDTLVFKVNDLPKLGEFLKNKTNQYELRLRYERENPVTYYEYYTNLIKTKIENFLNFFR